MGLRDRTVAGLLASPCHRLLSGSVTVIRYRGRRSGRTFATPVQYVLDDDRTIVMAGRPTTKTWWRNFRVDHPIELLVEGTWQRCVGRAVEGSRQPDEADRLLDAYLRRFPRAARTLPSDHGARVAGSVFVVCRPIPDGDHDDQLT